MTSQADLAPTTRALADRFPPTFAWGAATAAYQVEGAADVDGRTPSVWDTFSHAPGRVVNGDTGDVACDHYHRWQDDLDLMAAMGLRAYRFSTSWPRVQPGGSGGGNEAGLDFYDRLVDGLLERGIEPWVTLYHWDLPQPIEDRGGWLAPEVVDRFGEYAALVARRLGDRVSAWITLNETRTFTLMGYGTGRHAPGRHGWANALRAAHHAHLAHAAATTAIRDSAPGARVGIAHDVAHLEPGSQDAADREALVRYDGAMHRWFLDPTFGRGYPADLVAWYDRLGMLDGLDLAAVADAPSLDFLGVNYYRRERIVAAPPEPEWGIGARVLEATGDRTANGWEIHPDGLRATLERLARDYDPPAIAITENGATFPDVVGEDGAVEDPERLRYVVGHLEAAAAAIDEGVPLVGYFAWSLLDNFEWALGYGTRFGIVHVDFATQRRTLKTSGHWYRALLAGAPR
ncbi:MAG TPA: GH1 family beta-glucosidase [Candidatus Limnocylindrales bacterium]|nr:GH1 family beta-glucosidase [Candidatus Limnocylindrales bacterium]